MARTSRARKQKHKAKPKAAVRKAGRRKAAIAASIEVPVLKQRAAGGARDGVEKATAGGAEVTRGHIQHDAQQANNHDAREAMSRASNAPVAERQSESEQRQQIRHPPNRMDVYSLSTRTAIQTTQWLLALPFLTLQMWQAALLGMKPGVGGAP